MRFDDGVSSPFEGDYEGPEGPDLDARGSLLGRRATIQSVGPQSLDYLRRTYDRLRRRREQAGLPPIELLVRGDQATIILTGQLLIRTGDYPEVGPALEADGWERKPLFDPPAADCSELEDRIVRLVKTAVSAADIDQLVRDLHARGIGASAEHVAALASPVGKADGAVYPATSIGSGPGPVTECEQPRIKVGIIDSGIGPEREDGWLDIVERNGNLEPLYDANGFLNRDAGHGTFVAGVLQQAARGTAADITMYRVDLTDALNSELAVACAMIRAVKNGEQIVNLSFGTQTTDDLPPLGMEVALEVIDELQTGALLIAAAGNYGDSRPCYPAAFSQVVAVGGLDRALKPTVWSTQGFWLNLATVGEGIRSTYVEGVESADFDPVQIRFDPPDPWGVWIGTSFAAPQICGVLARICVELDPGRVLSPQEALALLTAAGRPVPGFGRAIEILPGV